MSRNSFRCTFFLLIFFFTFYDIAHSLLDPFSMGFIAAGGASLFYKREKVLEYTYCKFKECCIDSHIPADMTGM